jgi:adenosylcobinamide-GDP ribazoletransferase
VKYLLIALDLLTTIPLHAPKDWQAGDSGRAAGWYSFVGLCLGAVVASVYFFLGLHVSRTVTAAISLLVWVILTGGLHLDGLADCLDGMFYAGSRERRLQIMKDSRVGAFGVVGLILILLVKYSILSALAPMSALAAILLSTSLARWCSTLAGVQPPARPDGMGADFALGLKRSSVILGSVIPLALGVWLNVYGIAAVVGGLLATAWISFMARRSIGGVTGDVLGMIIETVEVVALTPFGFLYGSIH